MRTMDRAVGRRRRVRALLDPAARRGDRPELPAGARFREDGTPLDLRARPRQGQIGDCWVIAALLAVHEASPESAARLLDPLPGPNVVPTAVLLRGGRVRVPVDRAMPADAAGRWIGATQSGGGPGWAGLVEKAAALEVAGSYRWLARGLGRYGLQLLTGAPVRTHLVLPPAAVLDAWIREGRAVLASTHPLSARVATEHGPLPANHVMAVVGADPVTGHVRLRNPWRPDEVLTLDRRRFRRGFLSVDVTASSVR